MRGLLSPRVEERVVRTCAAKRSACVVRGCDARAIWAVAPHFGRESAGVFSPAACHACVCVCDTCMWLWCGCNSELRVEALVAHTPKNATGRGTPPTSACASVEHNHAYSTFTLVAMSTASPAKHPRNSCQPSACVRVGPRAGRGAR